MTDESRKRASNANEFEKVIPTRRRSVINNDQATQSGPRASIYSKSSMVKNYDFLTPEQAEEVKFVLKMYSKNKKRKYQELPLLYLERN